MTAKAPIQEQPSRRPVVMFIFQEATDTPGYYLYVLQRLQEECGIRLIVVLGERQSADTGHVVPSWRSQFTFQFVDLPEKTHADGSLNLPDLWKVLWRERPDVVVTVPEYLESFRRSPMLRLTRALLRIKLILKAIPFRTPTYEEVRAKLETRLAEELARPSRRLHILYRYCECHTWSRPIGRSVERVIQTVRGKMGRRRIERILNDQRRLWNLPDAHVNYVDDAVRVYGSFGVPREKIFVVRNSPDTDLLEKIRRKLIAEGIASQYRPHRIVHVGRLVEWKRVDLLLRAVASLRKEFPDIELEVIGDGPMKGPWQAMTLELGLDDRVRFTGGIYDYEELGRHLMTSVVYVLAGMGGISLNDAMAFGVPVICSVCDGTEKFLVRDRQNGLFFREGDSVDLATKIRVVFADPAFRCRLGMDALQTVRERVNVNTVTAGYLEAFSFVTRRRWGKWEDGVEESQGSDHDVRLDRKEAAPLT